MRVALVNEGRPLELRSILSPLLAGQPASSHSVPEAVA